MHAALRPFMEEKDWALHRQYLHYDDQKYMVGEHIQFQIYVDTRVPVDVASEIFDNIEEN